MMINYSDFEKVDIRVGTVIDAKLNKKSNNPSLYLLIDFCAAPERSISKISFLIFIGIEYVHPIYI